MSTTELKKKLEKPQKKMQTLTHQQLVPTWVLHFFCFWKVEVFASFILVSRKQMLPDGFVDDGIA